MFEKHTTSLQTKNKHFINNYPRYTSRTFFTSVNPQIVLKKNPELITQGDQIRSF